MGNKVIKPDYIVMSKKHMDNLYNSKNHLVKWTHTERLKKIVKLITKLNKKDIKILDAGCGEGHLLEMLSEFINPKNLYGIDITEEVIQETRKRGILNSYVQDLKNIEYPDETFDIVICTEVIEHIKNPKKCVDELKRITKKNGKIIMTFPNEFNWTMARSILLRWPVKVPDHVNSFTFKSIKKMFNLPIISKRTIPFNVNECFSLTNICTFSKD